MAQEEITNADVARFHELEKMKFLETKPNGKQVVDRKTKKARKDFSKNRTSLIISYRDGEYMLIPYNLSEPFYPTLDSREDMERHTRDYWDPELTAKEQKTYTHAILLLNRDYSTIKDLIDDVFPVFYNKAGIKLFLDGETENLEYHYYDRDDTFVVKEYEVFESILKDFLTENEVSFKEIKK